MEKVIFNLLNISKIFLERHFQIKKKKENHFNTFKRSNIHLEISSEYTPKTPQNSNMFWEQKTHSQACAQVSLELEVAVSFQFDFLSLMFFLRLAPALCINTDYFYFQLVAEIHMNCFIWQSNCILEERETKLLFSDSWSCLVPYFHK